MSMISLLIAGDFAPKRQMNAQLAEGKYEDLLREVIPIIKQSDYSVVNLEAPIVVEKAKPIEKTGPNLKGNKRSIEAIKVAGFDLLTLANNHIYDYGDEGINDTIKSCEEYGVDYVGAGHNLNEASKTFFKEIKGKQFAVVNFCENEWSVATPDKAGANPLNIVANCRKIKKL